MSIWAIVLAGGSGTRFGQLPTAITDPTTAVNKVMVPLLGTPVLGWSLLALNQTASVDGVVVVAGTSVKKALTAWLSTVNPALHKPMLWARPGADRRGSVASGLRALETLAPQTVLVHDGARPMAGQALFEGILARWTEHQQAGEQWVGLLAATPMIDTVKQCDRETGQVLGTLPRDTLWQVQTPQVFHYERLCQAHETVPHALMVTDDAQLIELARFGLVGLFPSHSGNLKVTTPTDLIMLTALSQHSIEA
jgi:2-C-methyl-D-erythritol 4-phosphate cytidylyltransferase